MNCIMVYQYERHNAIPLWTVYLFNIMNGITSMNGKPVYCIHDIPVYCIHDIPVYQYESLTTVVRCKFAMQLQEWHFSASFNLDKSVFKPLQVLIFFGLWLIINWVLIIFVCQNIFFVVWLKQNVIVQFAIFKILEEHIISINLQCQRIPKLCNMDF